MLKDSSSKTLKILKSYFFYHNMLYKLFDELTHHIKSFLNSFF